MLNFMALYWPIGWKKDTIKFGRPVCNPWGQSSSIFLNPEVNVLAFISNLRSICNPKMLKVGPRFFGPTPSVKWALMYDQAPIISDLFQQNLFIYGP
jgi:hypothetical protein